jgi:hypothetical protein
MLIFDKEYSDLINDIISDIYSNTEYWGKNENGRFGVIKPITKNDHPTWSNYNFINTHYTVRNKVVDPYVKTTGFRGVINKKESYKTNNINKQYFDLLWDNRLVIFGPESKFSDMIIDLINKTRSRGDEREVNVETILNKLDFMKVKLKSGYGSAEDFSGVDAAVNFSGVDYTAQIKPFLSYTKADGGFLIRTKLNRSYKQDIMIFSKKHNDEYHIVCFWNSQGNLLGEEVFFSRENLFLAVNYNNKTDNIKYKLF